MGAPGSLVLARVFEGNACVASPGLTGSCCVGSLRPPGGRSYLQKSARSPGGLPQSGPRGVGHSKLAGAAYLRAVRRGRTLRARSTGLNRNLRFRLKCCARRRDQQCRRADEGRLRGPSAARHAHAGESIPMVGIVGAFPLFLVGSGDAPQAVEAGAVTQPRRRRWRELGCTGVWED